MVLDENSHLKRSHRQLIDTEDYQHAGEQQIALAGINTTDYYYRGKQQITLENIDTADYHGDEEDNDDDL